jgi:hypothetical protein
MKNYIVRDKEGNELEVTGMGNAASIAGVSHGTASAMVRDKRPARNGNWIIEVDSRRKERYGVSDAVYMPVNDEAPGWLRNLPVGKGIMTNKGIIVGCTKDGLITEDGLIVSVASTVPIKKEDYIKQAQDEIKKLEDIKKKKISIIKTLVEGAA